ncbi:MAG TPA: hypothetical protein VLH85_04000 [Levilinea sp.]|nr:hypothetical protein [Levilinea sp.]
MNTRTRILISLVAAWLSSALLAGLASPGAFWQGWLPAVLLLSVALFVLLSAWQWAGASRALGGMIAAAFLTRLVIGMILSLAMPLYGHDEPEQNAGYHFRDAYHRDRQAWTLARSDQPLLASFGQEFASDQYGGLLSLSALVYRYLSPDMHRPYLILILSALITALGVPFFWQAVRLRWGEALAGLAAWFLVLYPDGIFFGSSQMREPFLLGLSAIAFWGVVAFTHNRRSALLAMGLTLVGIALISSRVALAVLAVIAVWLFLEQLAPRSARWRTLGWALLGAGALAILFVSWEWFHDAARWDLMVKELSSGWVQKIVQETGQVIRLPFMVAYGLAQPVLPAAVAVPAIPLWKTIIILRSLGWYLLAPLLIYAFFTVWKAPGSDRRVLVWLAALVLAWLVISSARAGGDMTDNPRYRSMFLPWMALLAAWGLRHAWLRRDPWLVRWLVVEGIFLAYFTSWYLSRYYHLWARIPFWSMVVQILVLSGLVLSSGWLAQGVRRFTRRSQPK